MAKKLEKRILLTSEVVEVYQEAPLRRIMVPTGWLVSSVRHNHANLTFVHDPKHLWLKAEKIPLCVIERVHDGEIPCCPEKIAEASLAAEAEAAE